MNPVVRKAIQAVAGANVWLYRRTDGRVGGRRAGKLLLLLTVPGRKSGTPHTVPVAYLDHDGGYLVVGTGMGGSRRTPQWFLNFEAAGKGHTRIAGREHDVDAHLARRLAEAELTAWQPLFDNAKKIRALLAELQDLTLQITGTSARQEH